MSCPDTNAKQTAAQGGSTGAPARPKKPHYKSPWSAFQAARQRKQADEDTRAAACRDPYWAVEYALEVDKAPRDDTRSAACRRADLAFKYAVGIDKAPNGETLAAVEDSLFFQQYLEHFGLKPDDLEFRILSGQPYDPEELLSRPDLVEKYGL